MSDDSKVRRMRGERGASLILAIAFMVVIGAISAAVMSTTGSGIQDRVVLDQARDREYAADGAIETTVAAARGLSGDCPAAPSTPFTLNKVQIHVDCSFTPVVIATPEGTIAFQRNFSFAACVLTGSGNGAPCTSTTTIIDAHVNFQGTGATTTTKVQAWSVNR